MDSVEALFGLFFGLFLVFGAGLYIGYQTARSDQALEAYGKRMADYTIERQEGLRQ